MSTESVSFLGEKYLTERDKSSIDEELGFGEDALGRLGS